MEENWRKEIATTFYCTKPLQITSYFSDQISKVKPLEQKLGGMMKGMWENVLAKEFFGSFNIDRGQVGGPQMPLLGRRDDKKTPNLGCRDYCT